MKPRYEIIRVFKSNIFKPLSLEILRGFMALFYLIVLDNFIPIFLFHFFTAGFIIYLISFPIRLFITNNNLIIQEDEIVVQSTLFNGMRYKKFKKDSIKEIIFKEDWIDAYPSIIGFLILFFPFYWEHKWIKIINKDGQKFTYYFYGIDYEAYYDKVELEFEEMFLALAHNNICVRWKSLKDPAIKALQEHADALKKIN